MPNVLVGYLPIDHRGLAALNIYRLGHNYSHSLLFEYSFILKLDKYIPFNGSVTVAFETNTHIYYWWNE